MLEGTRTSNNIFNFSESGIIKDILQLLLLFGLAVYFVYYAPLLFSKLFFTLTLFLFYKSKKDYIWFAFVFLLMMCPGTIFLIMESTDHNIPKIGFGSGLELGFFGFFMVTSFIKALKRKERKKDSIFKNQFKLLLFYLVFLNVITFFYGFNLSLFIVYLKTFLTYTLFYSLPVLMPKISDWLKFSILFSPFVILVFFSQLYHLSNGHLMIHYFLGKSNLFLETFGKFGTFGQIEGVTDLIRPTGYYDEFVYLVLLMSLISLNVFKNKIFRLIIVISLVCSILVVAISASKGSIIVFAFIILGYFLVQKNNFTKIFKQLILVTVVLLIAIVSLPQLSKSFTYSLERFERIVQISQGNYHVENRIRTRLPKVLNVALINPITGVGFSEKFISSYEDGGQMGEYHVGTLNLIANAGIIGLIIFIMFFVRFYRVVTFTKKMISDKIISKILHVLLLGFFGIIIINSTSYQLIGYIVSNRNFFFLALFISFTDILIKELHNNKNFITAKKSLKK